MFDKKKALGYWENIEDIDTPIYFKPMLAHDYNDYKDKIKFPIFSQPKLDGIRCIIRNDGMWSRNGKQIISAPHIFESLVLFFEENPDLILDGELYAEKDVADFNTIISCVRKTKPEPEDLVLSKKYIKYLIKELQLVTHLIKPAKSKLPLSQLHLGGGTPTFLSMEEMGLLINEIKKHFDFTNDGEFSIEIDPRNVSKDYIFFLRELGFNRVSIGVQDFNVDVQKAIHRIQTINETQNILNWSRECGFKSRSVDLIYGLPHQNEESFRDTVKKIIEMDPDRISVYNYAHMPHLFKAQRRINQEDLPNAATKLAILSNTISQLIDVGYKFIGMDHFSKATDELYLAQQEGKLHRNFQGYSTQADCDMLAIGITAIGKVSNGYVQHVKTLDEYYAILDLGMLPVLRGIELNADDLLRREIIGQLMCHFEIDTTRFNEIYCINFVEYFEKELREIEKLQSHHLVVWDGLKITIPLPARLLVRRVAMIFDKYLGNANALLRYSKII